MRQRGGTQNKKERMYQANRRIRPKNGCCRCNTRMEGIFDLHEDYVRRGVASNNGSVQAQQCIHIGYAQTNVFVSFPDLRTDP